MTRQAKGITGYVKRSQDESENDNSGANDQNLNYDKLIADMTKGFVEAQSQIAKPNNSNDDNQAMLSLLEQMSSKIDEMKNSLTTNKEQNSEDSSQNQETVSAQHLKEMFSAILQNDNNKKKDTQQGKNSNNSNQSQGKNNNKIAVQAAAQVLAQAQYELSNELEASLTKLRQVISKSEKIADKISSLIGSNNNKSQ